MAFILAAANLRAGNYGLKGCRDMAVIKRVRRPPSHGGDANG